MIGRSARSQTVLVRPAASEDEPDLIGALEELQELEAALHDSRLIGRDVALAYLEYLRRHLAKRDGAIFVAEAEGRFAGFVACCREREQNPSETADSNVYGYVADIFVIAPLRGRGLAGLLLKEAERYLAGLGLMRMRVNSLDANAPAQAAYRRHGFVPYERLYEKRISPPIAEPVSSP